MFGSRASCRIHAADACGGQWLFSHGQATRLQHGADLTNGARCRARHRHASQRDEQRRDVRRSVRLQG